MLSLVLLHLVWIGLVRSSLILVWLSEVMFGLVKLNLI